MKSCKRYYYLQRDIIQHNSYARDLWSVGEGAQPILREMENIQSSKDTILVFHNTIPIACKSNKFSKFMLIVCSSDAASATC